MVLADASVAQFQIKIGGSTIPDKYVDAVADIEVENSLHLPDVAIVRFHLDNFGSNMTELPDDTLFDVGKTMEISASVMIEDSSNKISPLFVGEITSLTVEYSYWTSTAPMLMVVQASDKSHRLHRLRKTRTFLKKKISDIAGQLAREAKLSAQTDTTKHTYEYLIQANQSDWEFLRQLADRVGFEMFASEGKLYFQKPSASPPAGPILEWGKELLQFQSRVSTASQVSTVKVKGWDWKTQKAILGKSTAKKARGQAGVTKNGGDLSRTFGDSELEITNLPVYTQAEANEIAEGLAQAIGDALIYAEGITSQGMPGVLPGKSVEIRGVGKRFSGKYYVTSTTHRFSEGGYTTTFIVSGSRAATLAGYMNGGQSSFGDSHLVQGVVTGIVTNNKDPDNLGRIKVQFPWIGDDIESDWTRMAIPDAGAERGFMWLPEVNDEVLVAFEHGDVNRPYVIGGLWNGKLKPPVAASEAVGGGKVNQRIFKSRSGHVIMLNDEQGKETIEVRDKTGNNEIVIDSAKNAMLVKVQGDMTFESKGKVTVKSAQDMSLESKTNLNIKAGANLKIEAGANLNLEARANATVKGLKLSAEGQTGAEVKGLTAKLTAQTLAEVKGALVKIN